VKKRREEGEHAGREGREREADGRIGEDRLKERKKEKKKRGEETQIEAERRRPVPYPATEVDALASVGTAGIR